MYKINKRVLYQKHYLLPDDLDLFSYLKLGKIDSCLFQEKGIVYIVMLDGEIFEYNCVASLIFEGINLGKSEEKIITDIMEIFSIEKMKVEEDFAFFVKDMLNNKIIIKC